MLVAFFAYSNDYGEGNIWCGYALSNTVWRFFAAFFSIVYGIVLCVPGAGASKSAFYAMFFIGAAWFCATTADCTAVQMANGVCINFFERAPNARAYGRYGQYVCGSEIYGVTITLDFVNSFLMLLALTLWGDESEPSYKAPTKEPEFLPARTSEPGLELSPVTEDATAV